MSRASDPAAASQDNPIAQVGTYAELVERTHALIPIFRERSEHAQAIRRMQPETKHELAAAYGRVKLGLELDNPAL